MVALRAGARGRLTGDMAEPSGATEREDRIVIPAVGADGALFPIGKMEAHRKAQLHLAVSVFVFDPSGRLLIQRRASAKYHCGGLWANTVCTHPHWNEPLSRTAERRLEEELGLRSGNLRERLTIDYRAEVGGGLVENERVTIFTGEADEDVVLRPDPDEVESVAWASPDELDRRLRTEPQTLTPWFRIYLERFPGLAF